MDNEFGQRIAVEARKLLKARFRHQGRLPTQLDCAGVVVLAITNGGGVVVDAPDYRSPCSPRSLLRGLDDSGMKVVTNPQAGDVVLFCFRGANYPQHLGIMVTPTRFVSIEEGQVCAERDIRLGMFHCLHSYRRPVEVA